MLAQVPLGSKSPKHLPKRSHNGSWTFLTCLKRGILLGVGLGSVATSLKILLESNAPIWAAVIDLKESKMNLFEKNAKTHPDIYISLSLAIIIPLMIPYDSDNVITPPTENLYQMIDSFAGREDRAIPAELLPRRRNHAGTLPMEVAILRHCFERNVKIFMLTWYPAGAPIIDYAINTVKEEYPDIQSGVDYCNFGYKPQAFAMVLGMGDNIANTMNTDAEGRKLENLPIMRGINNYSEMNLVIEFSGSSAGGTWIVYARPKFGLNVAVGVTAVMAADMYPYLQSGQLIGMLSGLKGAVVRLVDHPPRDLR